MTAERVKSIYQLKVTLQGIRPPVWRRIQVWEDTRLSLLHQIIQRLFNWMDCHLHQFTVGRTRFGVPSAQDAWFGRKVMDEQLTPVNRVLTRLRDSILYEYDFGDSWVHKLELEAILEPEAGVAYPHCLAGARNGPPEDVGGVYGYARYLEALADQSHPEHEALLEWYGPFDPERFSVGAINASLNAAFQPRSADTAKPAGRRRKSAAPPEESPGSAS
jgi:hypothetical protein